MEEEDSPTARGNGAVPPDVRSILVTGGAGFIGANLVPMLLDEGLAVHVLDDFSTGSRSSLPEGRVEIIDADVLEADRVMEAVERVDAVIHLAAETGVPGSLEDPYQDCRVNVLGTLNCLEAARRRVESGKPMPVVFSSSNAPLGKQPPPATEDKAPLPISPYGASKLAAEGYCLAYHGSFGVSSVILRFGNVYGPRSEHKESVVAKFCKDQLAGRGITIHGDGAQTRDFIHVDDLCRAILLALRSGVGGEVFQIATGVETSIQELAELFREVSRMDTEMRFAPARPGDIRENYSEVSKARRILGYEPSVDLETGLRDTWEWFRSRPSES